MYRGSKGIRQDGWISEKLKTLGRIWDIQNMFEPNEIVSLKTNPKVARQVEEKNNSITKSGK